MAGIDRPSRAFRPSGLQVVFALLVNPDLLNASLRELARASRVSLGACQGVMADLRAEGYVLEPATGAKVLLEQNRLADTWIDRFVTDLLPRVREERLEVSARAAELGVPLGVLSSLERHIGEYLLIGALARELHAVGVAGCPPGRLTRDLDVSIAVDSLESFAQRVRPLRHGGGLATRFRVLDHAVDVIPFGGLEQDGIIQPEDGILLDVTGMADAFAHPDWFEVGSPRPLRVASLADADDLGLLLDASHSGGYEERCWADPAAERFDYDPFLVGPFLTGRQIGLQFGEEAHGRLARVLEDERLELLVHDIPSGTVPRREPFDALRQGVGAG